MTAFRRLPTVLRATSLVAAYLLFSTSLRADDPKAEIRKIEEQLSAAVAANDAETLSKYLAPDWKLVGSSGVLDREDVIAALKDSKLKFVEYKLTGGLDIRVYGDAAVVIGNSASKGTWDDEEFNESDRFTDVFAKINGEWRCVSSQTSIREDK